MWILLFACVPTDDHADSEVETSAIHTGNPAPEMYDQRAAVALVRHGGVRIVGVDTLHNGAWSAEIVRTDDSTSETIALGPGQVVDIAVAPDGVYVATLVEGEDGVLLRSLDGRRWNEVFRTRYGGFHSVGWTGSGFLVTGSNGINANLVRSADGEQWTTVVSPTPDLTFVRPLGQTEDPRDARGAILYDDWTNLYIGEGDPLVWRAIAPVGPFRLLSPLSHDDAIWAVAATTCEPAGCIAWSLWRDDGWSAELEFPTSLWGVPAGVLTADGLLAFALDAPASWTSVVNGVVDVAVDGAEVDLIGGDFVAGDLRLYTSRDGGATFTDLGPP